MAELKCRPERMPSWLSAVDAVAMMPEYEPCLRRATSYLNLYSRFASEGRPSDELVDELYIVVRVNIMRAIAVNWGDHFGYPEEGVAEFFGDPISYIESQLKPPYPPQWRSGEAVWHFKFHSRLTDLLKLAKSRLDKIVIIERFTGLMHHNWSILSYAFAEYTEKPYIRREGGPAKIGRSSITLGEVSRVVMEVLECLAAGEKTR